MTSNGTAPVPECTTFPRAYCFTFRGPPNAGPAISCSCSPEACESNRSAMSKLDYGAPLTELSDCTEVR